MAAIDKIYIDWPTYCKFKEWCEKQPPLYDKYGTETKLIDWLWKLEEAGFTNVMSTRPVMNNPIYIDAYIIKNCPIQEVQNAISINYGYRSQADLRDAYEHVKNRKPEIQKLIDEADGKFPKFPDDTPAENIYFWYWSLNDFIIDDKGFITIKNEPKSTYEMIRDGDIEIKPSYHEYTPGKHFRVTKSPSNFGFCKFEKPLIGQWMVEVETTATNDFYDLWMWYHNYKDKRKSGTWDFSDDFIADYEWSSSCAHVPSITALKRMIRKWKLPIGTTVTARGRYKYEIYEFVVTK